MKNITDEPNHPDEQPHHDGIVIAGISHHYRKSAVYQVHDGIIFDLDTPVEDALGFYLHCRYAGKGVPILKVQYPISFIDEYIARELAAEHPHKPTLIERLPHFFNYW